MCLDEVRQRPAIHQLHDDPGTSIRAGYPVMHGDDPRMLQACGGTGLAVESSDPVLPFGLAQMLGQPQLLDSNVPPQLLIVGPPDRTHAALAE